MLLPSFSDSVEFLPQHTGESIGMMNNGTTIIKVGITEPIYLEIITG